MHEIILPTIIAGMAKDGHPFTGFLYAGLMIDDAGPAPSTVEFNTRMGDPETQPIMMRLKSDLLDVLLHGTDGTLDQVELLQWDRRARAGRGAGAHGYPLRPRKGATPSPACPRWAGRHGLPRRHGAGRRGAARQRRPRALRHGAGRVGQAAAQHAYELAASIEFDGNANCAPTSATAPSSVERP